MKAPKCINNQYTLELNIMANQFPESSKNNRKQSIEKGDKTYNGVPCKNCGSTIKHVSSYSCVDCNVKRSISKLYDDNLMAQYRTKEKRQKYNEENKEKRKSYKLKYSEKQEIKEQRQNYYKENKNIFVDKRLKRVYNISLEDYNKLLLEQNNKCAICGTEKCSSGKRMAVDHSHISDKVRGLLCKNCNIGIGMFFDNVAFLKNAIEYLENN